MFNLQNAALAAVRIARSGDLGKAAPFPDRLHQRHRLALDPKLAQAFAALCELPSIEAAFLSGSGPTIFAIPRDFGVAPGAAQSVLEQVGLAAQTLTVWAENRGLEVSELRS